jgi:hypothetical protein
MGKVNGKFVVLLEVDRILSLNEVAVIAAMQRDGSPPDIK